MIQKKKKPSRMDASTRREQLLKIAKHRFAADGFNGTTTREIAKEAGITEALVFRHFSSKKVLYEAVIEEGVAQSRRPEWRRSLSVAMEENDDLSVFRHVIEYVIESHRSDPVFKRLLLHATLAGHRSALRYVDKILNPLLRQLAAYVSRRQEDGVLRSGDPLGVLNSGLGMARDYAVNKYIYRRRGPKMTDAQAVELFLDITINGVRDTAKRNSQL